MPSAGNWTGSKSFEERPDWRYPHELLRSNRIVCPPIVKLFSTRHSDELRAVLAKSETRAERSEATRKRSSPRLPLVVLVCSLRRRQLDLPGRWILNTFIRYRKVLGFSPETFSSIADPLDFPTACFKHPQQLEYDPLASRGVAGTVCGTLGSSLSDSGKLKVVPDERIIARPSRFPAPGYFRASRTRLRLHHFRRYVRDHLP